MRPSELCDLTKPGWRSLGVGARVTLRRHAANTLRRQTPDDAPWVVRPQERVEGRAPRWERGAIVLWLSEVHGPLCARCGEPTDRSAVEIDHVEALTLRDGRHSMDNLAQLHGPCHKAKKSDDYAGQVSFDDWRLAQLDRADHVGEFARRAAEDTAWPALTGSPTQVRERIASHCRYGWTGAADALAEWKYEGRFGLRFADPNARPDEHLALPTAGPAITAARLRLGWSVARMAVEADVPEYVIRHAVRGGTPRPENALRIAETLGIDVIELWPPRQVHA